MSSNNTIDPVAHTHNPGAVATGPGAQAQPWHCNARMMILIIWAPMTLPLIDFKYIDICFSYRIIRYSNIIIIIRLFESYYVSVSRAHRNPKLFFEIVPNRQGWYATTTR